MRLRTVLVATVLAACVSAPSARSPRGDPDVLAAEEIARSNVGTLHEAIQRLRPHFFFSRGRTSLRGSNNPRPTVIVNNVPQASFESLRTISANDVQYVRFLRAPEATTRFGTGYMAGAIEVVLK
ncbi:MAG TPA: Plug domain-containing protein [Gemmatimonadaceae bacterium]|nr:Plug domain-containing protein [Gemmatimonadaceae bacterium]